LIASLINLTLNNDRPFPVVKVGTQRFLTDQSKILLSFIFSLSSSFDKKTIRPSINYIEAYLPPELKNVLINDKDILKCRKENYPKYIENNITK